MPNILEGLGHKAYKVYRFVQGFVHPQEMGSAMLRNFDMVLILEVLREATGK